MIFIAFPAIASMFKRIELQAHPSESFTFDGRQIPFEPGDSVAAALLAASVAAYRTHPVTNMPRGPHCMMGACFECLAEIDGLQNQQTCMTPARARMQVRTQSGAKTIG